MRAGHIQFGEPSFLFSGLLILLFVLSISVSCVIVIIYSHSHSDAKTWLLQEAGQGSCSSCPAGYFCSSLGTVYPSSCPVGHYCPLGSIDPAPCPAGSIGPSMRIGKVEQCIACPVGQYCQGFGNSVPTGPCAPVSWWCTIVLIIIVRYYDTYTNPNDNTHPLRVGQGFYCSLGNSWISPNATACALNNGTNCALDSTNCSTGDVCPRGHWCAQGAAVPTACPTGVSPLGSSIVFMLQNHLIVTLQTFAPAVGNVNADNCVSIRHICYIC